MIETLSVASPYGAVDMTLAIIDFAPKFKEYKIRNIFISNHYVLKRQNMSE